MRQTCHSVKKLWVNWPRYTYSWFQPSKIRILPGIPGLVLLLHFYWFSYEQLQWMKWLNNTIRDNLLQIFAIQSKIHPLVSAISNKKYIFILLTPKETKDTSKDQRTHSWKLNRKELMSFCKLCCRYVIIYQIFNDVRRCLMTRLSIKHGLFDWVSLDEKKFLLLH